MRETHSGVDDSRAQIGSTDSRAGFLQLLIDCDADGETAKMLIQVILSRNSCYRVNIFLCLHFRSLYL